MFNSCPDGTIPSNLLDSKYASKDHLPKWSSMSTRSKSSLISASVYKQVSFKMMPRVSVVFSIQKNITQLLFLSKVQNSSNFIKREEEEKKKFLRTYLCNRTKTKKKIDLLNFIHSKMPIFHIQLKQKLICLYVQCTQKALCHNSIGSNFSFSLYFKYGLK